MEPFGNSGPLRNRLICPACGTALGQGKWSADAVECGACVATYRRYAGVVDLRVKPHASCWTDTLVCEERELIEQLLGAGTAAQTDDLVRLYAEAHRPLPNCAQDDRAYMEGAEKRERWTVWFMDNAVKRYTSVDAHDIALDAGCGSGGALPHLAGRCSAIAGIDPDLPALLIAARRCRDVGVADRVTLVAAMLEQSVFAPHTFDLIKCTDVIEHVESPSLAAAQMAAATRGDGAIYVLTPNKWCFYLPEPHVKLWGIQFLPRHLADTYCHWRIGIPYSNVGHLLSHGQLVRMLSEATGGSVREVPIEDKHLNPKSSRGTALKRWFERAPLSWASRAVRPVQPVLEAIVIPETARLPA